MLRGGLSESYVSMPVNSYCSASLGLRSLSILCHNPWGSPEFRFKRASSRGNRRSKQAASTKGESMDLDHVYNPISPAQSRGALVYGNTRFGCSAHHACTKSEGSFSPPQPRKVHSSKKMIRRQRGQCTRRFLQADGTFLVSWSSTGKSKNLEVTP